MKFDIRISNVRVDGSEVPRADFQILLRFVADFVLVVNDVEVFREEEFPFVEFASQVAGWLRAGKETKDFDFESMESSVTGLVFFHRIDGEWLVGSMLPGSRPPMAITDDALERGVKTFLSAVPHAVDRFGVDVRRFVL